MFCPLALFMGQKAESMILSALSPQGPAVEVGSTYRRYGRGAMVELAYVTEVAADRMGIPHVRYQLQVERGSGMPIVENRTLALDVFQSRYPELVKVST